MEGTLERSISPELVEEAREPVSSWISGSREREREGRGKEEHKEEGRGEGEGKKEKQFTK